LLVGIEGSSGRPDKPVRDIHRSSSPAALMQDHIC
jgi:hypothetical protein